MRKVCANSRTSWNKGKKGVYSEETLKKMSDAKKGKPSSWKGKHPSLESRRKMSEARKGRFAGEDHPQFGKHHTEESCKKISESLKKTPLHPWRGKPMPADVKARLNAGWTLEKRSALSKKLTGRKGVSKPRGPPSEETRCKIGDAQRGSKNHQWRGGVSYAPYCEKFNKALKAKVRAAFGHKCVRCAKSPKKPVLSCHHITFDKKSGCYGKRWNLITLCNSCHGWSGEHRHEAFNLLVSWWVALPDINLNPFPFCTLTLDATYHGLKF